MSLEPLKISAKNLGQTALEDFCPRCYWLKLKSQFRLPYHSFPGIFSSIDSYTKKCFHHIIDSKKIPAWMAQAGEIVGYETVPHHSKSAYFDEKSGITLTGMPDDIWVTKDGSRVIPDAKTALKTNTQDKLLPMYEIQEIVYSILIDKNASLCLVYMEPKTSPSDVCNGIIDCGFSMQFSGVVVHIENDKSKVRKALTRTREIFDMPEPPASRSGCKDCESLDKIIGLLGTEKSEPQFECKKCHKKVDKLYGLFVPALCKECEQAQADSDKKSGNICGICRQPRSRCCC